MVRFQSGCGLAFDELYGRYFARITAFLAWKTGAPIDEARELANDAFSRVIEKKATYNSSFGLFSPWLYRIARNTAASVFRRRPLSRNVGPFPREAAGGYDIGVDIELRQCIDRLAPELREVIEFTFFAGLTDREAGESLQIPAGTVASRKHRAIAALRNSFIQAAVSRPLTVESIFE